jgi:hypothetical protein
MKQDLKNFQGKGEAIVNYQINIVRAWIPVLLSCTLIAQPGFAEDKDNAEKPAVWVPNKLPDGQPDVQGFWRPANQGTYSLVNPRNGQDGKPDKDGKIPKRPVKPSRIIDPADGQVPYQPWARTKQQHVQANFNNPVSQEFIDPQARCFPGGVSRQQWWHNTEIRQYPNYVVIIGDADRRIIPLDGRPHIPGNIKLWMSDSRGHWEGNTLIVDVTNSNAKHRLSNEGDFSSDSVHIQERFTFLDANTYQYQATYEDPRVYTRPWTVSSKQVRANTDEPDFEAWEYACIEGEKNTDNYITEKIVSQ